MNRVTKLPKQLQPRTKVTKVTKLDIVTGRFSEFRTEPARQFVRAQQRRKSQFATPQIISGA